MGFFGGGGGAAPANMGGATSSVAGTAGLVPAPPAGKNTRALFSDANFGELPLYPKFKASNTTWLKPVISALGTGGGLGSQAPAARRRQFGLGFFPDDGTIDTLGCRLVVAPASAINVHLALWECSEAGIPSTLIVGGTQTSGTTGNTDISVSVSATDVKRGYYFYSFTQETAGGSFNGFNQAGGTIGAGIYGGSGGVVGSGQSPYYTATTYNQTTHETFLYDASGITHVAFQYA
jgi:hypothetical protein